jgi:hypothetical protein
MSIFKRGTAEPQIIDELNILKQRLLHDSERVQREITEYATLSQAAMQSTRIIAESLGHFRKASDTALRKMPDAPPVSE